MQQTATPEIKTLSILHFAMFIGQLLFGIIALFLVYSKKFFSPFLTEYLELLISACILIGAAAYFTGNRIFKRKIEEINFHYTPLPQKLNEYRGASITRWAFMEFAVLISIIFFMLTNAYEIMIIAAAFMLVFVTFRPTTKRIAADLRIDEAELEQINKRIFF